MKGYFVFTVFVFFLLSFYCDVCSSKVSSVSTELSEKDNKEYLKFEKRMLSFIRIAKKFSLNLAYGVISEYNNITVSCIRTMLKLYVDLGMMKSWTWKLIDSMGKPPGGILKGTMTMMGDYDECLEIEEPIHSASSETQMILGKYCLSFIQVPRQLVNYMQKFSEKRAKNKEDVGGINELFQIWNRYGTKLEGTDIQFRLGLCMPSTCSSQDIDNVLKYTFDMVGMNQEIRYCETKETFQVENHHIAILFYFGIAFTLVVFGTAYDIYLSSKTCCEDILVEKEKVKKKGKFAQFLLLFSVKRNTKELFNDELRPEEYFGIPCLRGLCVLLLCFFIFVSSYAFIDEHYLRNLRSAMNYFDYLKDPLFAIIANCTLLVEPFFCMAGFFIFYKSNTMPEKSRVSVTKTISVAFFRCHLPLLTAIGFFLLLPLIARGPAWHEVMDEPLAACRKYWWTNMLLFSNFLEIEKQCLLHTWIMGCLTQLVIIGFIFKEIINRWPKFGFTLLIACALSCNVAADMITAYESLPPVISTYFVFSKQTAKRALERVFLLPYGHFLPFAIGMMAGYWMKKNPTFKLKKVAALTIWTCAVVVACLLIYGVYPFHNGNDMDVLTFTLYSSLHRPVFAVLSISCFIACIKGYGGCLNQVLSSRHFILLWKLNYLVFLFHWIIIYFHVGIARERNYYSHYEMTFRSLGHILASFVLAFLVHILFNGFFQLHQFIPEQYKFNNDKTTRTSSIFRKLFRDEEYNIHDDRKLSTVTTISDAPVHNLSVITCNEH